MELGDGGAVELGDGGAVELRGAVELGDGGTVELGDGGAVELEGGVAVELEGGVAVELEGGVAVVGAAELEEVLTEGGTGTLDVVETGVGVREVGVRSGSGDTEGRTTGIGTSGA